VFEAVRARVAEKAGPSAPNACLYWAAYGIEELEKRGVRACFQAGSCFWPRIRMADVGNYPETDPINFGYQWDDAMTAREAVVRALTTGRLPEIHVWLGLTATQEIIDFTAGYFPANCDKLLHHDWPGAVPPEFFWGTYGALPDGVVYRPSPVATIAAAKLAEAVVGDDAGVIFI
jgi:hypothetical protein